MKLEVVSIHNHGNFAEEYVILRATNGCNLEYYMLADTTYVDSERISNRLRHTHWFGAAELKQGDWVVLYTRPGQNNVTRGSDGYPVHHRFWGLQKAVWNDAGDRAVLFELNTWVTKRAK
jgi:hypothetical protein